MRFLFPTSRGWLLLVIHLICLALAFINQTIFTLVIAGVCLAILASSLLLALFSLHGMEVRRAPADDGQVGTPLELPLVFRNRLPWRRQAMVVFEKLPMQEERWHRQIVPSLGPRQQLRLQRIILPQRRGLHSLDQLILRSGDPAGLFRRERLFRLPSEHLVLPAIEALPELQLEEAASNTTLADRSVSRVGASQEFYGIREYRTTDGVRFINWRATARHRRLMVTEFEHSAYSSVVLLMDMPARFAGDGAASNLEYQIRVAAALVAQCSERFCSLAFAAGGDCPRCLLPAEATDQRAKLLRELAMLKAGDTPLTAALEPLLPHLEPHALVICLSLSQESELAIQLTGLAQAGMEVRWSCAAPQDFPGRLTREARHAARHPSPIPPGLLSPLRILANDPLERGLRA